MKCPYDPTIDCERIGYANWVTGKLPCDKCTIGILERLKKLKEKEK